MSEKLEDPITVEVIDGAPVLFWWQRFAYLIEPSPLVFYRRRPPWWTGESNPRRVDIEFWRVNATRDGSGEAPRMYDIRNDDGEWSLALAW